MLGYVGSAAADEFATKKKAAPAPAAAPASKWTGGQFGATGGNSSLAQNFAEPGSFLCPSGPCPETGFNFSGHPNSFTAGAFLGYRVQFGGIVVGIEGDASWKKADSSYIQRGTTPAFVSETFTGSISQGWDGSVRGRIGTLVTPLLLLYATAGVAFGDVDGSYSYSACLISGATCAATVTGAGSWSDTRVGYTVGAGIEGEIMRGVKARVEYRYTDLGQFSKDVPLTSTGCVTPAVCGTNAHIDLEAAFHTLRVGLGLDF